MPGLLLAAGACCLLRAATACTPPTPDPPPGPSDSARAAAAQAHFDAQLRRVRSMPDVLARYVGLIRQQLADREPRLVEQAMWCEAARTDRLTHGAAEASRTGIDSAQRRTLARFPAVDRWIGADVGGRDYGADAQDCAALERVLDGERRSRRDVPPDSVTVAERQALRGAALPHPP